MYHPTAPTDPPRIEYLDYPVGKVYIGKMHLTIGGYTRSVYIMRATYRGNTYHTPIFPIPFPTVIHQHLRGKELVTTWNALRMFYQWAHGHVTPTPEGSTHGA